VAAGGAWAPIGWGDGNYFASTLNNVFSSRRALLSGTQPAAGQLQLTDARAATATATVAVPHAGEFSVLVRYEGVYHFNTGFRVRIAQGGATSPGRQRHSDATLYISFVILHAKYAGARQNDSNVHA
jgi:hypothetical protein